MHHPCQFVQTFGHMRSNERANIILSQDTVSCVRFHINTPGQPGLDTQFVMSGQDLYAFHAALGKIVAKAKRYDRERAAAPTDEAKYEVGRRYSETTAA